MTLNAARLSMSHFNPRQVCVLNTKSAVVYKTPPFLSSSINVLKSNVVKFFRNKPITEKKSMTQMYTLYLNPVINIGDKLL